ncbi:MAG TPA: hypothetical protein DCY89_03015 [Gammaproteobacteria bacterium]|nr:hypothetical protein [Gammaproteobacteria bacterium]
MNEKSTHDADEEKAKATFEEKAKSTFSAERKEDYFMLAVAAIVVVLVLSGVIGRDFYRSLFF